MAPDINTLPPSSLSSPTATASATASPSHSPPAPRTNSSTMTSSPHSLAAAAAMNAGMHTEETRRPSFGSGNLQRDAERARRRSSIRMNLNLNDPSIPAPGEMQRSPSSRTRVPSFPHSPPSRGRAPSLGDLHQTLEQEQENQVNRLLSMIRQQQSQIDTLTANAPHASAVDDSTTPTSERDMSLPRHSVASPPLRAQNRSRSPFNISRQSSFADRSRGTSHAGSPSLRPYQTSAHESHDMLPGPATGRDESAFYQAETQNLTRENQMLRLRIRELERQLANMSPTAHHTHEPVVHSSLTSAQGIEQATEKNEAVTSTK